MLEEFEFYLEQMFPGIFSVSEDLANEQED